MGNTCAKQQKREATQTKNIKFNKSDNIMDSSINNPLAPTYSEDNDIRKNQMNGYQLNNDHNSHPKIEVS